jgi:flavin-dependent dehydrogenase
MKFDLIVTGSRPCGYVAAIRASHFGLKTAVVEREHLGVRRRQGKRIGSRGLASRRRGISQDEIYADGRHLDQTSRRLKSRRTGSSALLKTFRRRKTPRAGPLNSLKMRIFAVPERSARHKLDNQGAFFTRNQRIGEDE